MPHLVRAVPRVAPLRPLYMTTSVATVLVFASGNPGEALTRFRLGAGALAACLAFVLDDEAATTTASAPTTRFARRGARVVVGALALGAWMTAAALIADTLVGSGRPPWAAFLEPLTIAALSLAVGCIAIDRSDDGRGGVFGATVALTCLATAYLPSRWWWPLTARPEMTRLAVIGFAALALAALASLDPAVRRLRIAR
jgi:multisubunit Na+/H+ antiporter MnhB subunit